MIARSFTLTLPTTQIQQRKLQTVLTEDEESSAPPSAGRDVGLVLAAARSALAQDSACMARHFLQLLPPEQLQGAELDSFLTLGTEVAVQAEGDAAQIQHMLGMLDPDQAISTARLKLKLWQLLKGGEARADELYQEAMRPLLLLDSAAICSDNCVQYGPVMDILSAEIQKPSLESLPESQVVEMRRVFQRVTLSAMRCSSRKASLLFPFVLQSLHNTQDQVHTNVFTYLITIMYLLI